MAPPKVNVKERFNDGEVDLSMSELNEVPIKDILSLKRVHSLDLSNNTLTFLPKNFTLLTHLTKLDLSKNELTELPEDFGNLVKLKHLDLYKNQLQHLPLSFSKLKNLKWLDLKDNPLVPAVAKVAGLCINTKECQACAKNIVDFFTKLENQVSAELEMRNKDRQKQLEFNQKKKQEEKNMKKKEKQKEKKILNGNTMEPKKSNKNRKNNKEKVKNNNSMKTASYSLFSTIIQWIFFMAALYIGFVIFKAYNSKNLMDTAKNIVIQDLNKLYDDVPVWWTLSKQYLENLYKNLTDKQ
ncbi:leucine-rich repeat-containing protein 59 [Diorhabda carinulata]|uniref:leucine-rich repeat-containing protein 59 n=1 Tax=Diorhabda carinulata TaxID=1163345 RepID=UPI0025A01645|nr:leucine-rich repeat-containing protein 59 [Diorhabda carinulata]